ncbi:transposase family protein [Microtetraspora sp. NBRC 13810]|uniref:transposase family protein n=1 Tax=Microtetraspora sp. NBRC 13810 TaxID=3030990 RepID=UPI002554D686|nr:transposase family protein [Microtetraspora sp. NBRC 13810]
MIRRHRASIGSTWRRLNPGQQAMLVLVHLRKGETFAEVAAGFGVGVAIAWRYVHGAVTLLAQRSPTLDQALLTAKRTGYAFVVLDGTLIPIDRVAADRPYYSGKHKHHGMNVQVIAAPDGTPLWTSGSAAGEAALTDAAADTVETGGNIEGEVPVAVGAGCQLGAVGAELTSGLWIPVAAALVDVTGDGHGDTPIKMR